MSLVFFKEKHLSPKELRLLGLLQLLEVDVESKGVNARKKEVDCPNLKLATLTIVKDL
ncbi:hypothetical protein DEO72_LG2g5104 [Vigna unguiculata]|uniref:Uncharacterized protein n=1 Tax=Vigna unguiculata TaxID=3917 RepID=A0A4D6L892_VIGUN|nr:hypothetical protein DEO72_LG2g5104 [Vigna unguiculata]